MPDETTNTESEVPQGLRMQLAEAESGGESLSLLDIHPPEEWHDCPRCEERLHPQASLSDGETLVAVEYACAGPDHCGALWVWGVSDDELFYDGESEVVSAEEWFDDA